MNFAWNARLPRSIQESFTCRKSTTWDRRLYFPSEGRRAEDFFALKNPTASARFEPVNLGTKGQHATSRPPKPLMDSFTEKCNIILYEFPFLSSLYNFYLQLCPAYSTDLMYCPHYHPIPSRFLDSKHWAVIPLLINITLACAIRNALDSQEGFKLNGKNSHLVCLIFTLLDKNVNMWRKTQV